MRSFGTWCFKTCFWLNHLRYLSYLQFPRTVAVLFPFFFFWCRLYFLPHSFCHPLAHRELFGWLISEGAEACTVTIICLIGKAKLRSFTQEVEPYCDDLVHSQLPLVVKGHFWALVFLRPLILVSLLPLLGWLWSEIPILNPTSQLMPRWLWQEMLALDVPFLSLLSWNQQ